MHCCLFLVLALLHCCAGGAPEDSASQRLLAFAGDTVVLPCVIDGMDDLPTVEWFKVGPEPVIAFLYRQGCETHEMKSEVFLYRTNLFMKELNKGNISLMISNVQLSDAGKYICMVRSKTPKTVITWELVVGAVSEPKLTVVPAVDDGVTLHCEANCWFPEPKITFLDIQGNNISAENPNTSEDPRGCFIVTRTLTLESHTKRVTCRVEQPEMRQTRFKEIFLPAERSCALPTIITAVVTTVVFGVLLVCRIIYTKCDNSAGGQKLPVIRQPSEESTTSSNAEGSTQDNLSGVITNSTTEHLIQELESKLGEKEKIICQLTEDLNHLRSKLSPVVCQHGQPTIDCSPSKSSPNVSGPDNLPPHHVLQSNNPKPQPEASTNSNRPKSSSLPRNKDSKLGVSRQDPALHHLIQSRVRNHSSPALLTDNGDVPPASPSAGASHKSAVSRSMSLSESRPRPASTRSPRRYTTTLPVSNRYILLGDLPEDSELLLQ